MTDPRISLGPDVVGISGDAVVEALDRLRPIVRLGPNLSTSSATAAAALTLTLSRVFPHTILDGDAALGPNPWRSQRVTDALANSVKAIPTPTIDPSTDLVVSVGYDGDADIHVGGDDWTAALSKTPTPASATNSGLGLHAAAALAASEVSKRMLRPLGLVAVTADELIWNLLDHRLAAAADPGARRRGRSRLGLFGCGSVGSSAAGLIVCIEDLMGDLWAIDPDTIDPNRNPYRYPSLTGEEFGYKADWLSELLESYGWTAHPHRGDVASWVSGQPSPGLHGIALSSVDTVDGRRDVADVLAETTISAGVAGLALHAQVEHPADDLACPYCQFLDVRSALEESQRWAEMVGLTVDRIVVLAGGELLTHDDVDAAVRHGKVLAERAAELVGRRLDDLIRRAYAEAIVPADDNAKPAAVSAPQVSWMAGVLLAAEVNKASLGLPTLHRRLELDLSGVPLGVTSMRRRDTTGRCLCWNPARRTWAQRLFG
jgi:hypothetical protein